MSDTRYDVVGFAGAGGNMGKPISANLSRFLKSSAKAHVPQGSLPLDPVLRIWNRDLSKVTALEADHGCLVVRSLEELGTGCTIIHTCLSDDHALISVVTTLLACGSPGRIFVDHSTVLPETAAALSETAAAVGCTYVAAPVFGRPDAAAAAKLLMVVAGPAASCARVAPQHAAMSRRVVALGEHIPAANAMKLCGNFCIVSAIEMLSQGMTLAEKSGVPRTAFMDVMSEFFASPAWLGYGHRAAADDFDAGAGFTVELGLKDVSHMRALAHRTSTPLPLADMAFSHLLHARAAGHGNSDWGAIALAVRQAAGLPIPPPPQRENV